MLDQSQKKKVLEEAQVIAVVGLSDKPHRTSYQIAEAMQKKGYRIIPVNPTIEGVLGEQAVGSLTEIDEKVDIVNIFRDSSHLQAVAGEFLETDYPVFWAQLGVYDQAAMELLESNGRKVVMDSCIKVDHALLVKK
ncbi:CoA-binding protein [Alkalicoccus urumqiensis]|uniref:CoA-binding protein n=1 Tax=Alkalicoccus urumqiensis TaxID=1548213 RepID=A0A2P6MDS4_ALKUR|nr:CoA-binding protein [Alkalicoccus urumqiensis]PRO64420.1 CoA-binding protein [Alkalicoccus urumqiensis]